MFRHFKRALTAGTAVALALLGLTAVPASAATPPSCDGVWVVVQPDETKPEGIEARCATEFSTGTVALASAGFAAEHKGGVLTRIDAVPEDANYNTNGNYYWSYWKATVAADGSLGAWGYYTVAAGEAKPAKGNAEGWLLTNKQDAKGPALTNIATAAPAQSAPAASTPASPTQQPASGTPLGAVAAIVLVVGALLGLGGWWLLKGRRR